MGLMTYDQAMIKLNEFIAKGIDPTIDELFEIVRGTRATPINDIGNNPIFVLYSGSNGLGGDDNKYSVMAKELANDMPSKYIILGATDVGYLTGEQNTVFHKLLTKAVENQLGPNAGKADIDKKINYYLAGNEGRGTPYTRVFSNLCHG